MKNKLTKKEIDLMPKIRDKWIDIAFHSKLNKEEARAGVKWLYYISNLKEPSVVFLDSPTDFAKKFKDSVWDSVRASVRASVWASVWDSVRASVRASVWASVRDSVRASVWASVRDSVWDSVGASVRDSVWDSVWDSVRASVRDSVSLTSLCYDADWAAWYNYYKTIKVINNTKANKYLGFLKSGAFYCMFFEKKAFIMRCPKIVEQDDRKRLHSINRMALEWEDGTGLYMLHGVKFDKKWWTKIVNDKFTAEEVFAIDNLEHRRIAYEFMNKSKMKKLKDYKILDEHIDSKGNPMKIISFNVKGVEEPLKYYQCICPSTGREYFVGTDQENCIKAKAKSFGLEEIDFINEW